MKFPITIAAITITLLGVGTAIYKGVKSIKKEREPTHKDTKRQLGAINWE